MEVQVGCDSLTGIGRVPDTGKEGWGEREEARRKDIMRRLVEKTDVQFIESKCQKRKD